MDVDVYVTAETLNIAGEGEGEASLSLKQLSN